ncbi:hypothetical protein ZWY2020_035741 [Hordeum vulgare]|nr:hypothetical protein ZWY2020_035741 [Hordeum vulgare]
MSKYVQCLIYETCGICRMAFDGCYTNCKFPGDDYPIIWGVCNHDFHLHCKWVNSQTSPPPLCPCAVGSGI